MKTTIEERRAATKAIEKLVFNGVSPKIDRTIGDMADDIDELDKALDEEKERLASALLADADWLSWARDLGRFEVPVGVPYTDADVRASVEKRIEEIGRRAEFLNTEVLRARMLLRQQVEAGLGRFILSEVDVANHRVLVLLADDDDEDTAAQTVVGFMLPLLERLGFKVARTEVP